MKKTKEKTIKRMQKLRSEGLSLKKIAEKMSSEGYKTFNGLPIKAGFVHYYVSSGKTRRAKKSQMIEIVPTTGSSGKIVALVGNPEDVVKAIGLL